jgi:hypothetical protein
VTVSYPTEPRFERWPSARESARLLGLESGLGDLLADVLDAEAGGLSCVALARRVHRRKSDALAVLQRDRRFARTGGGRGARWHRRHGPWEQRGTTAERERDSQVEVDHTGRTKAVSGSGGAA